MHTIEPRWNFLKKLSKKFANLITPSSNSKIQWKIKNFFLRLSGINISKNGVVIDRDFHCLTGLENNIFIDEHATIHVGARFWNFNEIYVGKFCMFAADVTLTNGGHDPDSLQPFSGKLTIGNGCWIGNGARIVGPLTIGDNAIVAAGAVVVSDVPPAAIVAGVPAKVIKTRVLPEKIWHMGNVYFCPRTFKIVDPD
jgi:maltose O-acetyltransferase